jgi:hypothetical protein
LLEQSVTGVGKHTETLKSVLESAGGAVGKELCKGMEGLVAEARPELVWGFRCQGDFFAGRPSSVPPIAAGRHDCGESIEVEIDNDLEGFAGRIVA